MSAFVRRFAPFLLALAAVHAAPAAQDGKPAPTPPGPAAKAPVVEAPTFPNATCPIMGKKASIPLFVDTELGRFYVCCKPCFKKVLADVPKAHQTAFPVVEEHSNEVCPVSGKPIGKDAVRVTLQAHRFSVCSAECVPMAQQRSQLTLTKLLRKEAVDVGNEACPVTGAPVANAVVLVDGAIVRLAGEKHVDAVKQAPATMLAKARELAKAGDKGKAPATPAPATKEAAK